MGAAGTAISSMPGSRCPAFCPAPRQSRSLYWAETNDRGVEPLPWVSERVTIGSSNEKRVVVLAFDPVSRSCGVRGGHVLPGFKRVQDRSNTASPLA